MEKKELSDDAAKFVEETYEKLHGLDVHEQNKAVRGLCTQIVTQRKITLEKMGCERDEFVKKLDEFISGLQGVN